MFHFAQDKSTTIEFLKSELMQLLSDMRQEVHRPIAQAIIDLAT